MKEASLSTFRSSVVSLDLTRFFRTRRFASSHSSLSRDIKTRRLYVARSLLFLFSSHIDHSSRSCDDLRFSSFIDHRQSSIVVSRIRIRHRHSRSRIIIDLRSLDNSFLILVKHCLFSQKSSNEQQNRALSLSLSLFLKSCSLSLHSLLLLSSIEDDSYLKRVEELLTLNSTTLDFRTLTFLRQSSFHHRLTNLEFCCDIDWDLSIDVDCKDEANDEQEHDCYTINEENVSSLIIISRSFNNYVSSIAFIRIVFEQKFDDITLRS